MNEEIIVWRRANKSLFCLCLSCNSIFNLYNNKKFFNIDNILGEEDFWCPICNKMFDSRTIKDNIVKR